MTMDTIKSFFSFFTKITTGTVLVCAINMTLSGIEMCFSYVLWQCLLLGFVTSLVTVVFYPNKDMSKKEYAIRLIIHFLLITASVLVLGGFFRWYAVSFPGVIFMLLSTVFVYGFSHLMIYWEDKKNADDINRALEIFKNKGGSN